MPWRWVFLFGVAYLVAADGPSPLFSLLKAPGTTRGNHRAKRAECVKEQELVRQAILGGILIQADQQITTDDLVDAKIGNITVLDINTTRPMSMLGWEVRGRRGAMFGPLGKRRGFIDSYTVTYVSTSNQVISIEDPDTKRELFISNGNLANPDMGTTVQLSKPVVTRSVRITPETWSGVPYLEIRLFVCMNGQNSDEEPPPSPLQDDSLFSDLGPTDKTKDDDYVRQLVKESVKALMEEAEMNGETLSSEENAKDSEGNEEINVLMEEKEIEKQGIVSDGNANENKILSQKASQANAEAKNQTISVEKKEEKGEENKEMKVVMEETKTGNKILPQKASQAKAGAKNQTISVEKKEEKGEENKEMKVVMEKTKTGKDGKEKSEAGDNKSPTPKYKKLTKSNVKQGKGGTVSIKEETETSPNGTEVSIKEKTEKSQNGTEVSTKEKTKKSQNGTEVSEKEINEKPKDGSEVVIKEKTEKSQDGTEVSTRTKTKMQPEGRIASPLEKMTDDKMASKADVGKENEMVSIEKKENQGEGNKEMKVVMEGTKTQNDGNVGDFKADQDKTGSQKASQADVGATKQTVSVGKKENQGEGNKETKVVMEETKAEK